MENFSEMLGGITTCSIPFLDLPPQFHDSSEIGARFTGYSEIFSGFSGEDFAINFQEFIGERPDSPNGRAQMELKEFFDHSTGDAENVITDIICNDITEKATCNTSFNDVEQEITSSPSSTENSYPEELYAKSVPVDYSSENVNNGDIIYTTVSGINLQTQPSIVPPPMKTPPKIIAEHNGTKFDIFKTSVVGTGAGLIKQTRNHQIQYKVGDSSCGNYIKLDAQSAIAAMKEAMEQAQARLKHAKEIMERKRGIVQSHEQLGPRGNIKHDGRKELESKTSENEKTFDVEDECCVLKGVENQLMGQKDKLKSSQTDYKLEENSEGWKIEALNSELVRNNRSRVVNEHSKHVDIENKLKTSSHANEATEMESYYSNSKNGSATYREEMDNLSDDGNKNHTLKEFKQENNCSSETLSNGVDFTNPSAFEEIPSRDNGTNLDSLNVECLHVKSLDHVLIFEENLQDDKEDGIMQTDRNDFTKCTLEVLESFNEELMSKNDVALDVNSLVDNSEEPKPTVEGEKKIEREHEKVQAREVEEEEVRRERKNTTKRTKNVARQKEHNKTQEKQLKAETLERQKIEKALKEAKLRAEHAAAERAAAEARERAVEKALADAKLREETLRKSSWGKKKKVNAAEEYLQTVASSSGVVHDASFRNVESSTSSKRYSKSTVDDEVDPPLVSKGTPGRQHGEKVLAEKNIHDILAQREQEERNKLAESLDACINRWSRGKEGNLRALLSTLQFILGPDSGWQPVTVTDVISAESLKRAYRKATLCVHPDKLQQRGANVQQKYTCEKVFDLLKEAWDRFNLNE